MDKKICYCFGYISFPERTQSIIFSIGMNVLPNQSKYKLCIQSFSYSGGVSCYPCVRDKDSLASRGKGRLQKKAMEDFKFAIMEVSGM